MSSTWLACPHECTSPYSSRLCSSLLYSTDSPKSLFRVQYRRLLTVAPTFHQVCSSAFIGKNWTTLLHGHGLSANSDLQLDRRLLSKHLQVLGWMCDEEKIVVDYSLSTLQDTKLVTAAAISRRLFETEISAAIDQFIK